MRHSFHSDKAISFVTDSFYLLFEWQLPLAIIRHRQAIFTNLKTEKQAGVPACFFIVNR
jgi:hypothetical protein